MAWCYLAAIWTHKSLQNLKVAYSYFWTILAHPDHCAKKDTYMMREIRSLIQEMAHKTHVLYLGVQEKAKQRTECQKIKFCSKNRNSDYKTKNRRTCIKHKKMLGISAKFYVLYMFSSFLFYSHNLIRHQKKQATLCNKMFTILQKNTMFPYTYISYELEFF